MRRAINKRCKECTEYTNCPTYSELTESVETLNSKVVELQEYAAELNHRICEYKNSETSVVNVAVPKGSQYEYTPDLRHVVVELVTQGVAYSHVVPVITASLSLVGKTLSHTPSKTTIQRIATDLALAIALKHIEAEYTEKPNTTLATDETSKHGYQYGTFAAHDSEQKCWVLGLREMSSKSSETTLDTLVQILGDIDRVGQLGSNSSKQILVNFRNTMSDRAATEKKFNELFETYRSDALPDVIQGWDSFEEQQQQAMTKVLNFFCGLHLLVNAAEVMNGTLCTFEKVQSDGILLGSAATGVGFAKQSEPGVVRLVRVLCKAFAHEGSEQAGAFLPFKLFLEEKGVNSPPFASFKGNRFNILFYNAEIAYTLHEHIQEFLAVSFGTENRLLQTVLADLQEPIFQAELKVLGLISKMITSPLWRLLESRIHILDMNSHYKQLVDFLEQTISDPSDIILGQSAPFGLESIDKDQRFSSLIVPDPQLDEHVHACMSAMLIALHHLFKRLLSDHLGGGILEGLETDENVRHITKSAPKHNKLPESVFGLLDHLIKSRPYSSAIANEAFIMFVKNKTSDWLNAHNDKHALIEEAQALSIGLRAEYKNRQVQIRADRVEKLRV